MKNFIRKFSEYVDRISRFLMASLFIMGFLATLYQVFSRYVLQSEFFSKVFPFINLSLFNFTWIEELIRYLFIWVVFLGIGTVYKESGHAHIEILYKLLNVRWTKRLKLLVEGINVSFFLVLLYFSVKLLTYTSKQISPSLFINMSIMYFSIVVCSVICNIHAMNHFFQLLDENVQKENLKKVNSMAQRSNIEQ
ncbi:TRAP transporter small permease [Fervidibacillus albus]|uniref:TRAP transporter small permease n=1 Tax=Fervidibacillus albus TaxID=2980026 RepID=A0A9E8RVK0_9BACI|nr:TRAP transporter small permease [Fervidibacillus albus]WAA09018.1 TRAP transporter small permease [Fervidibacillus albus]